MNQKKRSSTNRTFAKRLVLSVLVFLIGAGICIGYAKAHATHHSYILVIAAMFMIAGVLGMALSPVGLKD